MLFYGNKSSIKPGLSPHRTDETPREMNLEAVTDSKGNTVSFLRQIPSYGLELVLTAKDATKVSFEMTGDSLLAVAERLGSAAVFAAKVGR